MANYRAVMTSADFEEHLLKLVTLHGLMLTPDNVPVNLLRKLLSCLPDLSKLSLEIICV